MSVRSCIWKASLILGSLATPALAADNLERLGLEDLLQVEIEGASRVQQSLAEAPSSATVIGAEDIRRFGFRTLGESLEAARGVYLTNDRAYSYLGVRGFNRPGDYNSRLLVLVDGARSNSPLYDQAMIGNESPLDLDWIRRLEFAPGPSSASYGGNALFGIVNAVLWTGAELNGTRVAVDAGDGGGSRVSLLSGQRTENGLDWVAGVSSFGRRGDNLHFPEYDATGGGIAHRLDGERSLKLLLKAGWEDWRASLNLSSRRKDVPTAYYSTLFDTGGNYTRDQEAHFDLSYARPLAPALGQKLRVHLGQYRYDAEYPFAAALNRDEGAANWWSGEYQLTYTGLAAHRLLGGIEVRRATRLMQKNYDIDPRADNLDDNRKASGHSLFVQDEWRLAPGWLANLGLRIDRQSTAPSMSSPRLALIWRPSDTTTLKGIYGRAFRAPNQYELYYGDAGATQKGNPELRPERITSRELVFDLTPTPTTRFGIGHYRYTVRDLIDQETDPADGLLVFRNQAEVQARGWEVDAEATFAGGWRLRASTSFQHTHMANGEAVNSPHRLGKLLLDGPLPGLDQATLGLNLQAVGRRNSLTGEVGGYVTGNLVLRQTLSARAGTWSLGLYNLGDTRYRYPVGRELAPIDALRGEGRQWRLRWEKAL